MKKILFITAFVPSKIAAGENYSRQLINDISQKSKVDLIFFKYKHDEDYVSESENVRILKVYGNSVFIKIINCLLFPFLFPLFTARFNFLRLLEIKKILKKTRYDKVVFDFSQTFLYARFLKSVPAVLNSHDVIAQRYSRVYAGLLEPLAKLSEGFVLHRKNTTIFTLSEKDRLLIRHHYSVDSIVSEVYLDSDVLNASCSSVQNSFVLFANWKRPDNYKGLIWFLKNVLPSINNVCDFIIIGTGLPDEIKNFISGLTNVRYLGFMDNPYPVIADSKSLISPLFSGAGVKIKVIESLACGTPVIGTAISFEGVSEVFSGYNFVAESKEEFISAILNFKFEKEEKMELKRLFLSHYQKRTLANFINS